MKCNFATSGRTFAGLGMIALVTGVFLADEAFACNIPVFRYALERWHPDPYRVTLFHRGSLSEGERTMLAPLEARSEKAPANIVLRLVDVDALHDDTDRALFAAHSGDTLPWLAVQYPRGPRVEKAIWSGPLNDETVTHWMASPLREELIQRLVDGQTGVWLMLESGASEKDDAVAARIVEELENLERTLKLPELSSDPQDSLLSDAPLRIAFSLLRVPRNVATEQMLVAMLLGCEPDLVDLDEPMVFPVFGRGRALLPLVGAGITAENIQESARFLTGSCSCEVKELNPGFDLLLAADWDVLMFKEPPSADVLAARATAASGTPELVTIPPGAPSVPARTDSSASATEVPEVSGSAGGVALVGLLLVVIFVVAVAWKQIAGSATT